MAANPAPPVPHGPRSLSKSVERALGCERYFVHRYLRENPPTSSSGAAQRGSGFHEYRSEYVRHLREAGITKDPLWARAWVKKRLLTEDAVELILADAERFTIDPQFVYATEWFLAIDESFRLVEQEPQSAAPGRAPVHQDARFHGTLDHVEVEGDAARILDAKTGYSDRNVRDYEASHYAGLLFAALPQIQDIEFSWNFPRAGASSVPFAFSRRLDYPWIRETMLRRYAAMRAVILNASCGEEPRVDPVAGLCGFCQYTCPVRTAAERGLWIDRPLQTDSDAIALARRMHSIQQYMSRGRDLLEAYLERNGRLSLGSNLVAELRAGATSEYRLDKVADVLGIELPESAVSSRFDVPLDGLLVGSTALKRYAKAQKRAGLMESLQKIARTKPRFRLHIGRAGEEDEDTQ